MEMHPEIVIPQQNQFDVVRCTDKNSAIQQGAEALHTSLATAKAAGKPVLLLLSGGSALELLKEGVNEATLPDNLTICALDDRVYKDPKRNTYTRITTDDSYKFISSSRTHGVRFINTSQQSGDKDMFDVGNRVNREIQEWLEQHADGQVIATMGMGHDGHTAGIFPGHTHPLLREERMTDGKTVPNYVQAELIPAGVNEYARRISATALFLGKVDEGFALVTGEDKREPLQRVLSASDANVDSMVDGTPAVLWRKMPQVTVFTDIGL